MTKDEIKKLAVEAGWPSFAIQMLAGTDDEKRLQRFAELVAAAEREECAKIVDEMAKDAEEDMDPISLIEYYESRAAAIRARGNA